MNFKKEYQQIILPLIKAAPVIIVLVVIAVLVMRRATTYMTPEFRANGAIKINNLSYSQAAFNLFGKEEGALPKQNENFLTEVEVFQSKDLIKKTLKNLDWELTTYRVGKLSLVELYNERPLNIEYNNVEPEMMDEFIYFDYLGNDEFRFRKNGETDTVGMVIRSEEKVELPSIHFSISKKTDFLKEKPTSLKAGDRFAFKINSLEELATMCHGEKLFVKPVEKDISIIKIYFNHELPEKAQAFVNGLMETYIQQGKESKLEQADETLDYMDSQLDEVTEKLRQAESQLSYFRSSNRLLNATLETDATLKELTQLDLQKVDLEMKHSEMEHLQKHLFTGNDLKDCSPNFAALQDPIFRESYLKALAYESQRKDLLQKYTEANPAVTNLDEKINETRTFLNESVLSTIENLMARKGEITDNIQSVGQRIKRYPEKERRLVSLEREVSLNEGIYNYLMRKHTELAIGRTSDLNPHKIIEHAELPTNLASPNKGLLYGLAVLLALMAGMFYAYLRSYFKETIHEKEELENLPAPVLGVVYKKGKKEKSGFAQVSGLVAALGKLPASTIKNQGQLFVTTSTLPGEGKSFTSTEVAKAFAAAGKKVLIVDMDVRRPSLAQKFGVENANGYSDILEKRIYALNAIKKTQNENLFILTAGQLQSGNHALLFSQRSMDFIYDFRWHFDVVIVDTPPVGVFEDSLPLMNQSTANLFMVRAGYTQKRMLGTINNLIKDLNIPNLQLVLNDVKSTAKIPSYKKYIKNYYQKEMSYA